MPRRAKNQRSDKRFQTSLQIGTQGDKRLRKYFYGETKEEADEKKLEYMRTHPADTAVSDREIILSKWADRWLKDYKSAKADNTQVTYKTCINYVKAFEYIENGKKTLLSGMKMTDIKPYHIQALFSGMAEYSDAYIDQMYVTMNQVFKAAEKNHIIGETPVDGIELPEGWYEGYRSLEEYEKKLVFQNWKEHRAGIWAMIMMYAGLRKSEMFALKWESVDFDKKELHVENAWDVRHNKKKKTKSEAGVRDIPIVPPLLKMLTELKKDKGFVCLTAEDKHLTAAGYKRGWDGYMLVLERSLNDLKPYKHTIGWRKDIDRAKENYKPMNRFTAHDLRYTFATMLYDAGVDVKTAQILLGHKDLSTTMKIYTQLSERKKKTSLDKLNKFFKKNDF
jgi:integrase